MFSLSHAVSFGDTVMIAIFLSRCCFSPYATQGRIAYSFTIFLFSLSLFSLFSFTIFSFAPWLLNLSFIGISLLTLWTANPQTLMAHFLPWAICWASHERVWIRTSSFPIWSRSSLFHTLQYMIISRWISLYLFRVGREISSAMARDLWDKTKIGP